MMKVTYTLLQKTDNRFSIAVQNETYSGVVRNYEIINNIPGKSYKGGTYDFLNSPPVLQAGEYEYFCILLQFFVKMNIKKISQIKSSDHYVHKNLNF